MIEEDIENNSANFEDFMSESEIGEIFMENEEDEEQEQEWHPSFPVDMSHPKELTELQKERALRVYESIEAHLAAYPEEQHSPLICITQDWRVRVDFGGWNTDSDFRDVALCVMCQDEEGWYISLDYVEQCIPFIEKELSTLAESCIEMYGKVPNHHEEDMKMVLDAEMELLSILSDETMKEFGFENILIAMDTCEGSIYPLPDYVEHDDYGGIISYISAASLVKEDGTIEVDKMRKLIHDFVNPI